MATLSAGEICNHTPLKGPESYSFSLGPALGWNNHIFIFGDRTGENSIHTLFPHECL